MNNFCSNCFSLIENAQGQCPRCSFPIVPNAISCPRALSEGVIINHQYLIGRVLSFNDYEITYLAKNLTTNQIVCLTEFFPKNTAMRAMDTVTLLPISQDDSSFTAAMNNQWAIWSASSTNTPLNNLFLFNNTIYNVSAYHQLNQINSVAPLQNNIHNNASENNEQIQTDNKHKKSKKIIPIAAGIGVLLVVLIGVFFYFSNFDFKYEKSEDGCIVITEFTGKKKEVVVPEKIAGHPVVALGNAVFKGNKYIVSVTIPQSVKTIGDKCFAQCQNLKTVELANVNKMGVSLFADSNNLDTLKINGLVTLTEKQFEKSTIKNISLSNVMKVDEACFRDSEITSLSVNGCDTIGERAFASTKLKSITISKVNYIEEFAFWECKELESVDISTVTSISAGIFVNCSKLKTLNFDNVQVIGQDVFRDCTALSDVTLSNISYLPEFMFSNCKSLNNISIPEGCKEIRSFAFDNCSSLRNLDFYYFQDVIIYRAAFYGTPIADEMTPYQTDYYSQGIE